jgi:hypothetical protein
MSLSGGGCRSALLRATSDELTAAAAIGMIAGYDTPLDHNVIDHTWTLPPGWPDTRADWPDLAACQALLSSQPPGAADQRRAALPAQSAHHP